MLFRQLFDTISSTFTYLMATDYGQSAIIIDPVLERFNLYKQLISEYDLTLVATLETHIHADHITASGLLRQAYRCDIILHHQEVTSPGVLHVVGGQHLNFNDLHLTVIHTPGHAPDSLCYLMDNQVFTGDTLLIRGTGRTDFQKGDPYAAYDSLFNKLLTLPDNTLVYPGHSYNGINVSTIGEEKQFNPRLQVQSTEDYAKMMSQLNLKPPEKMHIAIPANLNCGLPPTRLTNQ